MPLNRANRRPAVQALLHSLGLFAVLCITGCYRYAQVDVCVVDDVTSAPVSGIVVRPVVNRFLELFPPDLTPGVTDARGHTQLRVCINYKSGYAGVFIEDDRYLLADASQNKLPLESLSDRESKPYEVQLRVVTVEVAQLRSRQEWERMNPDLVHDPRYQWVPKPAN